MRLLVSCSRAAYASLLGALLAGCTYVPLTPRFPPNWLLAILGASDVGVVIVDEASMAAAAALIPAFPRPLTVLLPETSRPPEWLTEAGHHHFACRDDIEPITPAPVPEGQTANDGPYLPFTSGTSGAPKGVLVHHRNVTACNVLSAPALPAAARRSPHPAARFFARSFAPRHVRVLEFRGLSVFPAWERAREPRKVRSPARADLLVLGAVHGGGDGAPAPARPTEPSRQPLLGEALRMRFARMCRQAARNSIIENLHGPAGATITITAYRVPDDETLAGRWGIVPIRLPLPGQQTALIDEDGYLVRDGEPGELCIGGSLL
jgi:non-ribosomal peptide synthetase component F